MKRNLLLLLVTLLVLLVGIAACRAGGESEMDGSGSTALPAANEQAVSI